MHIEICCSNTNYSQARSAVRLYLSSQNNTLFTHTDISLLRKCVNVLSLAPNRYINVVGPNNDPRTRFVIKTLLHLGVSVGQINLNMPLAAQAA